MKDFFEYTFEERVLKAIDNNELQLVQLLLGTKYCQLWKYWLMHSVFSYGITVSTQTLRYQLLLNMIVEQSCVLAKFAKTRNLEDKEINQIRGELERVEEKILEHYSLKRDEDLEGKIYVNMRDMFSLMDNRFFKYSDYLQRYGKSDDAKSNNPDINVDGGNVIAQVIAEFKDNVFFPRTSYFVYSKHKSNYDRLYNGAFIKMHNDLHHKMVISRKRDRIKLSSTSNVNDILNLLKEKEKKLIFSCNNMRTTINYILGLIDQIKDTKFPTEVYNFLLCKSIKAIISDNPEELSEDKVVEIKEEKISEIKAKFEAGYNYDYKHLNEFMKYASEKKNPNIDMISLLIINSASLYDTVITNPNTKKETKVAEYFTNKLKGKYAAIVNKSIHTLMKDVNKELFGDFSDPVYKEDSKLMETISSVPYEGECLGYTRDAHRMFYVSQYYEFPMQSGMPNQGFATSLRDSVDKYIELVQCNKSFQFSNISYYKRPSLFVVDGVRYHLPYEGTSHKRIYDAMKNACCKLHDMLHVGYVATVTCDDNVIIDYLAEIELKKKDANDPMVKKIYEHFLKITNIRKLLEKYDQLPQSMCCNKWYDCEKAPYITPEKDKPKMVKGKPDTWGTISTVLTSETNVGVWSRKVKVCEEIKATEDEFRVVLSTRILNLNNKDLIDIVSKDIENIIKIVSKYPVKSLDTAVGTVIEQIKRNQKEIIAANEVNDAVCKKLEKALSLSIPCSTLSDVATSSNAVINIELK